MAYYLTELENYKTQSKFESSLILKIVMFEFLNAYNAMIYIAFFKRFAHGSGKIHEDHDDEMSEESEEYMGELETELGLIYGLIFLKNLYIIGRKWYDQRNKDPNEEQDKNIVSCAHENTLREQLDKQIELDKYEASGMDGTFGDYLELIVQYGFVTLFAVAFPLAPVMAYITNILEVQVDKDKLLTKTRRPRPQNAKNIGQWYTTLEIVTSLSMVTNAGILCFTIGAFSDWPIFHHNAFIPFLLILSAMYYIKKLVEDIVPEVPAKYDTVVKRHDYIINHKLKGLLTRKEPYVAASKYLDFTIEGLGG